VAGFAACSAAVAKSEKEKRTFILARGGGGCRGDVAGSLCKRKNIFSARNMTTHMDMTSK
jgi:hypothetical protein